MNPLKEIIESIKEFFMWKKRLEVDRAGEYKNEAGEDNTYTERDIEKVLLTLCPHRFTSAKIFERMVSVPARMKSERGYPARMKSEKSEKSERGYIDHIFRAIYINTNCLRESAPIMLCIWLRERMKPRDKDGKHHAFNPPQIQYYADLCTLEDGAQSIIVGEGDLFIPHPNLRAMMTYAKEQAGRIGRSDVAQSLDVIIRESRI